MVGRSEEQSYYKSRRIFNITSRDGAGRAVEILERVDKLDHGTVSQSLHQPPTFPSSHTSLEPRCKKFCAPTISHHNLLHELSFPAVSTIRLTQQCTGPPILDALRAGHVCRQHGEGQHAQAGTGSSRIHRDQGYDVEVPALSI